MEFTIAGKKVTIGKPGRFFAALAVILASIIGGGYLLATSDVKIEDAAKASDTVFESVKAEHGALPVELDRYALATPAREAGEWEVQHVRAGKVIWEGVAHNFLADEGESNIVDCVYRSTNCPTAFTMSLLSTAASPAETSTWAALSSSELVTGTSPGYAAAAITRDSTGWPTLDTVASGTGGCTESSCARVSTAQVVITASGNWTVAARYITIRGTVSAAQKHFATAQLSADRQLQNGDQLNLTYRQAMQ